MRNHEKTNTNGWMMLLNEYIFTLPIIHALCVIMNIHRLRVIFDIKVCDISRSMNSLV